VSKVRGNADGVVEWSRRDPWQERMVEMVEKHIRKACDLNDIDIHDLDDVIGDAGMVAVNCAFEDCCTTVWEDGSNLCADYLKRRGWKETVINRAYIEALRDSVMTLYEVIDVRPGESFIARDLVRGGDPVRVCERTATKTLVVWDIVATRIVTVRGVVQMTGAVLPIGRDLAEDMLGLLRQFFPKGTDLSTISQTELNDVARLMNQRPRKTLGWKTPEEALAEELAAFRSNVALET